MAINRFLTIAGVSMLLLFRLETALGQLPPHAPGTICATPQIWCWAQPPGPPGSACYCPSPRGLVRGVLR